MQHGEVVSPKYSLWFATEHKRSIYSNGTVSLSAQFIYVEASAYDVILCMLSLFEQNLEHNKYVAWSKILSNGLELERKIGEKKAK